MSDSEKEAGTSSGPSLAPKVAMFHWLERLFELPKFRILLAFWTTLSAGVMIFFINQSFKPELAAPRALISNLDFTRLNISDSDRLRLKWSQILQDLNDVKGFYQALGLAGRFYPVKLKISSVPSRGFKVDSDSIEIGISYALARGQIAHALLQSRFLQLQTHAVSSDSETLNQILYADVLWAAAHSVFELGIPETNLSLRISPAQIRRADLKDLLLHAASKKHFSTSEWSLPNFSLEQTASALSSNLFTPLSLREFLLLQILKSETELALNERINFLKKIAAEIPSKFEKASPFGQIKFEELTQFINTEFETFDVPLRFSRKFLSVDAFFDSAETVGLAFPIVSLSLIVKQKSSMAPRFKLLPGDIDLTIQDVRRFEMHTAVYAVKDLSQIERFSNQLVNSKKILAIENNKIEFINYSALKNLDFKTFALKNPQTVFAVFDKESLNFATTHMLNKALSELLTNPSLQSSQTLSSASDTLGISTKHWDSISHTYQASGTIEALQMWRPKSLGN